MRSILIVCILVSALGVAAQQKNPPKAQVEKTPQQKPAEQPQPTPAQEPAPKPPEAPKPQAAAPQPSEGEERYDMTEIPPVVTHHQITLNGKVLHYTATTGRLPIKRADQTAIEAEMFFVAYTLDGQDVSRRPLTFAFNGGPGSASVWLHMGALGPKRVVLQPEGFMPPAPYRLMDNPQVSLDRTDLVLVDAIGTGWSRAADAKALKKFLGVKGDIESYSEFIRLYLARYDRWSSPLFLFGESYGTTRAAGIAGYLADRGITFNGLVLMSMALDFGTLEFTKGNDLPYILILPSYTMAAAYHHKLPPELTQDLAKTRQEVANWASTGYAQALAKGDALTPQQRQATIDQLARYTGLTKQLIDNANLRIDVRQFTHNLLLDQKLRVGRLDTRFTGPDPEGLLDTDFYDPTGSAIVPPFTAMFNNYVRTDLGYRTDMPYNVFSYRTVEAFSKWDWGSAAEGFPNTSTALRQGITKNPYLRILVMEGYYDLATPFYAADYTMDHLDLTANLRKNISYATYDCGHMVYLRMETLAKMKRDFSGFIDQSIPAQ